MTLEDIFQDLPSTLHLMLASQPPGADQSQQEGNALRPIIAHTPGSCFSCASLLAKKSHCQQHREEICCALCASVQKGMFACKQVIKNVRCFNFVLLYHLIHCKGNSITIISIISNCTFVLQSKILILEIAQPTLCADIWPHLHDKEIAQEDESLA